MTWRRHMLMEADPPWHFDVESLVLWQSRKEEWQQKLDWDGEQTLSVLRCGFDPLIFRLQKWKVKFNHIIYLVTYVLILFYYILFYFSTQSSVFLTSWFLSLSLCFSLYLFHGSHVQPNNSILQTCFNVFFIYFYVSVWPQLFPCRLNLMLFNSSFLFFNRVCVCAGPRTLSTITTSSIKLFQKSTDSINHRVIYSLTLSFYNTFCSQSQSSSVCPYDTTLVSNWINLISI